jgi:hypothetical protein
MDTPPLERAKKLHQATCWSIDETGLVSNQEIYEFKNKLTEEERVEWNIYELQKLLDFYEYMDPQEQLELMTYIDTDPEAGAAHMEITRRKLQEQK